METWQKKGFPSKEAYNEYHRNYRIKHLDRMRKYHAQYQSKWRKRQNLTTLSSYRWAKKYPSRRVTHQQVYLAIKAGKLVKTPCKCGETNVVAHHPDYSQPLNVIFLCRPHHRQEHYAS